MGDVKTLNPLIAAGIEAGGSVISGVASALTSKANRDWQEKEATKQRQWQSMPEQVARARMAGMNPNLVFGKGTGASTTPAVPAAPAMPTYPVPFSGLGNLALGKESLEVEKPVKESEEAKNYSEKELNETKKLREASEKYKVDIDNLTEFAIRSAELTRLQNEATKAGNDAEAAEYAAQREKLSKDLLEEQYPALAVRPQKENEKLEEEKKTEKARQKNLSDTGKAALSEAASARENARSNRIIALATDKEKRATVKRLNVEAKSLAQDVVSKRYQNIFTHRTMLKKVDAINNILEREGIINDVQRETLKKLAKENKWFDFKQFLESAISVSGAIDSRMSATGDLLKILK